MEQWLAGLAQASVLRFHQDSWRLEGGTWTCKDTRLIRICLFILCTQYEWTNGQVAETICILQYQIPMISTQFAGCLRRMLDSCRSRTLNNNSGLHGWREIWTPSLFRKTHASVVQVVVYLDSAGISKTDSSVLQFLQPRHLLLVIPPP
jgi:hypothetical protein